MEKKTLTWSFTVDCTAIVEGDGDTANVVQVIATDAYGKPVSLSLAIVDCASEEREIVAQGIFDFGE